MTVRNIRHQCVVLLRPSSLALIGLLMLLGSGAEARGNTGTSTAAEPLNLPAVPAVVDCPTLASDDISQAVGAPTSISSAAVDSSNKSAPYCKVQIVVEDHIKFELHLPVSTWTQRLLFGGGPGAQGPQPVNLSNFVTASWQDLGYRGNEDAFANNYQARVDYGYRGPHLRVLAAKALIVKYYGQPQKYSYYNACSEPGREGMMEVQRFPEDFDGVAAGCPPINMTINNGLFYAWNVTTNTGADGKLIITPDKLSLLHKTVLDECDAADGLKDGLVSDPLSCHPKLTKAECKPGQDPATCLTSEQVHAALEIYKGAHDAKGDKMEPIGALPGSELSWSRVMTSDEARAQTNTAIRGQFSTPALPTTWTLADLKWDRATFNNVTSMHSIYDATDPDLTAFAKAGHKLILWQGLADVNVLPAHTVLYYTALQKTMGAQAVDNFVRFYVLPGVGHCGGGDGPSIKDFLVPVMVWIERGVAPGALPASHIPQPARGMGPGGPGGRPAGPPAAPDMTRPVYPYPYLAKYTGTGDMKDAANFVQGPARPAPASLFEWLGSGFYTPGYEKWCTATGPTTLNCKSSR